VNQFDLSIIFSSTPSIDFAHFSVFKQLSEMNSELAELRRVNEDLRLQILSIKDTFHQEQLNEQEQRVKMRQSFDDKITLLQDRIQELSKDKEELTGQLATQLDEKATSDKLRAEIDLLTHRCTEYVTK
jgi:predicted  nucleic acid-binding Zn-ribbon protein